MTQAKIPTIGEDKDEPGKQEYIKETLATLSHSPNQLAFDRVTNSLFFSFDSGQGEYLPIILNLDTKKLTILKGVKDAFAMANDPETDEIYFGGSHGIYKYTSKTKMLKRLNIRNLDVWWLYVKKNILYFIKFPSLTAYFCINKSVKKVKGLEDKTIQQYVFDKEENIYFINSTGLYGVRKDREETILLRDYPKFLGMATDNKGDVYVCSEEGIFVVSKIVRKVTKLINIQGVLAFTFDRDNNIIYSDSHELVRVLPVTNSQNTID